MMIRIAVVLLLALPLVVAAEESPDFARDIAPIFMDHCTQCHRPGDIAPMSFASYHEIRPWAKSIEREVTSRRMPPFAAGGEIGKWENDLRLTDTEIETIQRWVAQGARRNRSAKPALLLQPVDDPTRWKLGEPDIVIQLPEVTLSPESKDEIVAFFTDFTTDDELWVRAFEFSAGNRRVVHHANVGLLQLGTKAPPDDSIVVMRDAFRKGTVATPLPAYLTYLPGRETTDLGDDEAFVVPAGRRLLVRVHYSPSEWPETDASRIGLYLADGMVRRQDVSLGFEFAKEIRIPAFADDFRLTQERTLDRDVKVAAYRSHMHYRGKAVSVTATYPDGSVGELFDIPTWDFHWQRVYVPTEQPVLPAGTTISVEMAWDNSAANELNPNPRKAVRWGPSSNDEMGNVDIILDPVAESQPLVEVRQGRLVEKSD